MSTDQVSQHYEELLFIYHNLLILAIIYRQMPHLLPRLPLAYLASSPPRPNMPVQPLPPEILRHTFTFFPHQCAITHLRCHTGDPLYCCSLVSATWRSIAIPLIWRTFNINWDPPLLRKLLRFLTGEQPQTFRFATHVTLDEDQIMSNPSPNLPSPNLPSPNLPSPNLPSPNLPSPNLPSPNLPSPNHRALRRAALAIINSRRYLSYVRYLRLAMNAPHDDLTTPATLTVMLLNLLPRNQLCALTLYYPTDSRSHDMPVNLCIDALAPLLGRLARISIETADDFPFGLIPSTLPATLHHLDLSAAPGRTSLELLTPTEPHRDDKRYEDLLTLPNVTILTLTKLHLTRDFLTCALAGWGVSLRDITFDSCPQLCTDAAIKLLARECPNLRSLDLLTWATGSRGMITDAAIRALVESCPRLEYLRCVGLEEITDAAVVCLALRAWRLKGLIMWGCPRVTGRKVLDFSAWGDLRDLNLHCEDGTLDAGIDRGFARRVLSGCPKIKCMDLGWLVRKRGGKVEWCEV
ncbi:hypothetical protein BC938DRAFT_470958 [Jimgerdemannia flammicorona]|uniref:Uncharacterized protein n=1 Tax=Jimgerdemannia flammicorona TaxID=994334 RepID=A0A433Q937_9FUNG|nr:hypothetical protein BC938DRAFT_470958 [Jimgerdemannia flammicorona]